MTEFFVLSNALCQGPQRESALVGRIPSRLTLHGLPRSALSSGDGLALGIHTVAHGVEALDRQEVPLAGTGRHKQAGPCRLAAREALHPSPLLFTLRGAPGPPASDPRAGQFFAPGVHTPAFPSKTLGVLVASFCRAGWDKKAARSQVNSKTR